MMLNMHKHSGTEDDTVEHFNGVNLMSNQLKMPCIFLWCRFHCIYFPIKLVAQISTPGNTQQWKFIKSNIQFHTMPSSAELSPKTESVALEIFEINLQIRKQI